MHESDESPILPPSQPAQPAEIPQPSIQPTPNAFMQPTLPASSSRNVFLMPLRSMPFADGYNHKLAFILGCAQISIGILHVIFQCAAIGTQVVAYQAGIWCGMFFIITGAFGVNSATNKTKCKVITFMVLSIIAASIFVLASVITSAAGLGLTGTYYYYQSLYRKIWELENEGREATNYSQQVSTSYALYAILLSLAVAEFVVAIWSAAICCGGICCRKETGPMGPTDGYYAQVVKANQQAAQIPMQVKPQEMPGQGMPGQGMLGQGMPGQRMPGQNPYICPPLYTARGPPKYEQNGASQFKA